MQCDICVSDTQPSRSAAKHDNFFCQGVIISSGLTLPPPQLWCSERRKPKRHEGITAEPATLSSDISSYLECDEEVVLLFINDECHHALLCSKNVPHR